MRMYQTKNGYMDKNFKISLFDVSNFAYRKRICYRYISYKDLLELSEVTNLTLSLDKGKSPGA